MLGLALQHGWINATAAVEELQRLQKISAQHRSDKVSWEFAMGSMTELETAGARSEPTLCPRRSKTKPKELSNAVKLEFCRIKETPRT